MRQAVLLALAAGASGLSEEYVRRNGPVLWEYWKDIHKTGYSAVEEPKRYKNFLLNMIAAAYVEREKPFLACTANKYADLSKDEFQAQHPQHAQQLKLAPMEQYGVSSPGDEVHCAVAGNEQEVCHIPGHPDAELFGTGKVGALDAKMECSRMTARRKQVGGASESRFTIGEVFRTMDTYCPVPAVAPGIDCKRNSRPSQTEAAGIVWQGNHTVSPLPHETIADAELPDSLTWCNKDRGTCDQSREQHIPLSDGETNYSILTPCGTGCTGAFDPDRVRPKTDAVDVCILYIYGVLWSLVAITMPRLTFEVRRCWARRQPQQDPPRTWLLPLPLGFIDTRSPRSRARPATPPTPRQGCSPPPRAAPPDPEFDVDSASPRGLRRELQRMRLHMQHKDAQVRAANARDQQRDNHHALMLHHCSMINGRYQHECLQHQATNAVLTSTQARLQRVTQQLERMQQERGQTGAPPEQRGAAAPAAPPPGSME